MRLDGIIAIIRTVIISQPDLPRVHFVVNVASSFKADVDTVLFNAIQAHNLCTTSARPSFVRLSLTHVSPYIKFMRSIKMQFISCNRG